MRRVARTVIDAGLRRSPAHRYFQRRTAGSLAVLAYHGVDHPERFAEHMDLVLRSMHPVSLDDVLDAAVGRRDLPARSVLVTLDDGHRSVLDHGAPILAERGIPSIAFIVAALVDTDEPYWWVEAEHLLRHGGRSTAVATRNPAEAVRLLKRMPNVDRQQVIDELRAAAPRPSQPQLRSAELRRLETAGVEIGNHTMSHPCLDTCDDATVVAEVDDAHRILTDILGKPPRAFAYPNGNWDPRAEAVLQDLDYQAAFRFDHRHNPPDTHPLRLSRLRVNSDTTMDRFAVIVSGLHPALHRARGGR